MPLAYYWFILLNAAVYLVAGVFTELLRAKHHSPSHKLKSSIGLGTLAFLRDSVPPW